MPRNARLSSYLVLSTVAAALALMLHPPATVDNLYDFKRFIELGALSALIAMAAISPTTQSRSAQLLHPIPATPKYLAVVFLLWGLVASLLAAYPLTALAGWLTWLVLAAAIIYVATAVALELERFSKVMAVVLNLLCFAYGLEFILHHLIALTPPFPYDPLDDFIHFANRRFLSQFQSWTLPLLLLPLFAQRRPSPTVQTALYLNAGLWWCILLASGGRGAIAAQGAALLVVVIAFRAEAMRWARAQLTAVAVGIGLYTLLFVLLPPYLDPHRIATLSIFSRSLDSLSGRGPLWDQAVTLIRDHPWFGVGPLNYGCLAGDLSASHPHDLPLQIASEWGLPALLLLLALLLWMTWAWYRANLAGSGEPPPMRTLKISLSASVAAALAHSLVSGVFVMPLSQFMLPVVGGWMLATYVGHTPAIGDGGPLSLRNRLMPPMLALLVLGSMWYLSLSLYRLQPPFPPAATATDSQPLFLPRFWIDGKVCR